MQLTHYEALHKTVFGNQKRARRLIEKTVESGVNEVWKCLPLVMGHTMDEQGRTVQPWKGASLGDLVMVQYELTNWALEQQENPYSYSEYCTNPEWHELFQYLTNSLDPGEVHTALQLNYQLSSHERCGKKVYSVCPDLAVQLKHTELRGLTADDLRLPFESIYIMAPQDAGLKVWNTDTGWHPVIGVYITEEHGMVDTDAYRRGGGVGHLRGWRMMIVGHDKAATITDTGDDALGFFRIVLEDGASLPDILAKATKEMQWDMENNPDCTWDEHMSWDWEQQFRWAMNVVLYATWEEPGEHWIANKEARQLWERMGKLPSNSKKRKSCQRKFQTIDKQRRIQLGTKIVIDRKRRAIADPKEKSGTIPDNDAGLRVKTRVSGHWRRQPHGPRRSKRRLQWIEPHWRNLEGLTPARSPTRELR